MKNLNENIDQIIINYLTNNISDEDLLTLNGWRNQSVQNNEEFEQMEFLWQKSQGLHLFNKVDVNSDWNKVREKIKMNQNRKVTPSQHRIFPMRKIAAVLVPLFILSSSLYLYLNVPGFGRLSAYRTTDTIETIHLPDNSIVVLNINSKIIYNKYIDSQEVRKVELKGEAFFEVTHNETPFIVEAGDADVSVMGTEFNVNNHGKDLYVTVVSGKVNVDAFKQNVVLTKGERAILKQKKLVEEEIISYNDIYWKSKRLKFNQATLKEICTQLKNSFPEITKVSYKCKDVKTKVTTTFDNQSLNEIIEELSIHFNKKIVFDGKNLIISD